MHIVVPLLELYRKRNTTFEFFVRVHDKKVPTIFHFPPSDGKKASPGLSTLFVIDNLYFHVYGSPTAVQHIEEVVKKTISEIGCSLALSRLFADETHYK